MIYQPPSIFPLVTYLYQHLLLKIFIPSPFHIFVINFLILSKLPLTLLSLSVVFPDPKLANEHRSWSFSVKGSSKSRDDRCDDPEAEPLAGDFGKVKDVPEKHVSWITSRKRLTQICNK